MSELLKGNFKVKNKVTLRDDESNNNDEYRKKALNSIGGSMVFVERDKLFWDDDLEDDKDK
tara:strand:- start:70 stop:252 length:183 start_codon:yes stop_codon:yes gene_type:complete